MIMCGCNPRLFSPEANKAALFEKRLRSLPVDEQDAFRNRRHPCQDKDYPGLIMARCCAEALQARIEPDKNVKRVEPGHDSEGFTLVVVVNADVSVRESFYRGYLVHAKI